MPEIGIADKVTLDAVNTKIDTNVGAKTDAASATGSLHAKVKAFTDNYTPTRASYLDRKISQSGIKSVQRGTHSGDTSKDITISISTIDPSKAFVILNFFNIGLEGAYMPVLKSLLSNSFTTTISCAKGSSGSMTASFSWQVIEFY